MNRDPTGYDCTRDPIFLVQTLSRFFIEFPRGCDSDEDGTGLVVSNPDELEDWIKPFVDEDGTVLTTPEYYEAARDVYNGNYPLFREYWRTETVFLTRTEAEAWAAARHYRWEQHRVYCTPCDGNLADLLREYPSRDSWFSVIASPRLINIQLGWFQLHATWRREETYWEGRDQRRLRLFGWSIKISKRRKYDEERRTGFTHTGVPERLGGRCDVTDDGVAAGSGA